MNRWIDVSIPLRNGMVHWPGDPAFHIEKLYSQKNGDLCTLSKMDLSVHTGTHMDAPLHFLMDAPTMESMPLEATLGLARVIEIHDPVAIRQAELVQHAPQPGERILFKTGNSAKSWNSDDFDEGFIYIAKDAADYLAECGIRTVGVDYLSVGGFKQDIVETHQALLGGGIWIIEGLDLREVEAGTYELACLPLKLVGSDGAPARAALRRI